MLLHVSCVAIDGKAVLLSGPSGVGKSDLALRLIDEGAELVADDQTEIKIEDGELTASPPAAIAGLMEVRHAGLIKVPFKPKAPVALYVELTGKDQKLERLPEDDHILLEGRKILKLRLPSFAASTPAKIRAALRHPFAGESDE